MTCKNRFGYFDYRVGGWVLRDAGPRVVAGNSKLETMKVMKPKEQGENRNSKREAGPVPRIGRPVSGSCCVT